MFQISFARAELIINFQFRAVFAMTVTLFYAILSKQTKRNPAMCYSGQGIHENMDGRDKALEPKTYLTTAVLSEPVQQGKLVLRN